MFRNLTPILPAYFSWRIGRRSHVLRSKTDEPGPKVLNILKPIGRIKYLETCGRFSPPKRIALFLFSISCSSQLRNIFHINSPCWIRHINPLFLKLLNYLEINFLLNVHIKSIVTGVNKINHFISKS